MLETEQTPDEVEIRKQQEETYDAEVAIRGGKAIQVATVFLGYN